MGYIRKYFVYSNCIMSTVLRIENPVNSYISTTPDSIEILKRNKLIIVYVDLIEAKINHLKIETCQEKRDKIEDIILELIACLRGV